MPRSPFLGVNVPNVIVDETFFGEGHAGFLDALTQELVELFTSSQVGGATDRPGKSEEEDFSNLRSQIINLVLRNLLDFCLDIGSHKATDNTHRGLSDVVIASLHGFEAVFSSVVARVD